MTIQSIAISAQAFPVFVASATSAVISTVNNIAPLFNACFKLGQIPYFFAVGAKEIIYDGKDYSFSTASKASNLAKKIFEGFKSTLKNIFCYETIHGVLMVGCGICEIISCVHYLGLKTIAAATLSIISNVSLGFFALANFLMVCEQIRILINLEKVSEDASQEVKDATKLLKIGAIISLLSGISYLVSVALILCGGPAAVIVLFMLIGLLGGGLKILFDIVLRYKKSQIDKI